MYDIYDEQEFKKIVEEIIREYVEENGPWIVFPDIPIELEDVRKYIGDKYGDDE